MIEVKSKDGSIVRCELNEFDYNGTFMGECFISATVKSHVPIDFTIGDYLVYRNEIFVLNYTPAKQKQASPGSCGDAFVYDSLKFNSLADELTRCRFLDYVPYDNKVHFSNLSVFSFYATDVRSLAERIQANLDRMYSGGQKWTVTVHDSCVSKDRNISVSNINCFDALSLCKRDFDVNFIIRGRVITIGAPGILVGETFGYGKGKGLYAIEQTTNEDSLIITRLRAYGSTRNMPYMHYNNPAINNLMLPGFSETGINTYIDSDNISKYGVREGDVYFDGSDPNQPEIYPSMEGMKANDLISAGIPIDLDPDDNGLLDELVQSEQMTDNGVLPKDTGKESDKLKPNFKITLKDIGFDINKYKSTEKATISMKSGMCIGREFEITKCVKIGNKYELTCNRFTDEDINIVFPNTDYQISSGDKFVLLNIEMPEVYIRAAEYRLLTLAKLYLSNVDESKYIYSPKIDEIYMANHPDIHDKLKEGDVFDFSDVDLDISAKVIIQSLSIHVGKSPVPTYEITLNNDLILSIIEKIQNSLNGTGNTTVKIIRSDIEVVKLNDLTIPTDENVFSALRTLDEIGHVLIEANDMFLRKDIDDTMHGNLLLDKKIGSSIFIDGWEGKGWEIPASGAAMLDSVRVRSDLFIGGRLGSPTFASGFPEGWGWDLSPYTIINSAGMEETRYRFEIDDIVARGSARFYEMIISQLRGENDNVMFSGQMKVAYYDQATGRLYLDTELGILYNPFRHGDLLEVQRYNGMPSADNDYYITKQYELQVEEVGIGSLADGEDRLDWITFKNFVGDLSLIAKGDVLTRVDSATNSTRKGVVKITTIDELGTPHISALYGMKTNPDDCILARMGNCASIRTKSGKQLDETVGFYARGAHLEYSTIVLNTGETIEQTFTAMGGKFESLIGGIRDDMSSQAGNILVNSSFDQNTNYWTLANTVHFINVNSHYLWMDGSFYVDKEAVADIYNDGGQNRLRIRNTYILQQNALFRLPERTEPSEEGYTYSFSFKYKVLRAGTLSAGFPGTDLYVEQQLSPSDGYQKLSKVAKWDETGDFELRFTGEILIYGVSLFNDSLADAQIKLQTQIDQTNEYIKLLATKDYVDKETGEIYVHYDSQLQITAEQMSGISTKVDNINNKINTAGWITRADGVDIFAEEFNKTGVLSSISQLNVKYNSISSSVSENEQAISAAQSLANSAASQAATALTCGIYGQEQYSQTTNPWNGWSGGTEYKHVGALWYNPSTGLTQRYVGTSGGNNWETVSNSAISAASYVLQNKDKWSMVVANFDSNGNPTSASGIVTTAYGNSLWVKSQDYNGNNIASLINQDSTTILLKATKIKLEGAISANGTFKIDTSGFMAATGGRIASFNIGSESLTISMNNIYSGFGVNTGPAELGLKVPLWIKNSASADTCIAAHFYANGATNPYNNIAISIRGAMSGLAFKTRQADSSVTLNADDVYVSCYNSSSITVRLPSSPVVGKFILIKNMNGVNVTVNGNGKSIHATSSTASISSSTRGEAMMFVYDNQYWSAVYIKW